MTISEVSKKYNLTQDTLRYYERIGVIPQVHRTAAGLRDYTEEDCSWVELVKCMRRASHRCHSRICKTDSGRKRYHSCQETASS